VAAGRGSDVIRAARGRVDTIDCGPGRDRAIVGANDKTKRCERVSTR
jgi:hypothetical protein